MLAQDESHFVCQSLVDGKPAIGKLAHALFFIDGKPAIGKLARALLFIDAKPDLMDTLLQAALQGRVACCGGLQRHRPLLQTGLLRFQIRTAPARALPRAHTLSMAVVKACIPAQGSKWKCAAAL